MAVAEVRAPVLRALPRRALAGGHRRPGDDRTAAPKRPPNGLREPLERLLDGLLAVLVILRVVVAALAVTGEAVLTRREALAVELEAARVAAVARLALVSEEPPAAVLAAIMMLKEKI